jgi:hypothetical protein
MPRGGKRKGAGRPALPIDEKAEALTMRVRPAIAEQFRDYCTKRDVSQVDAFSAWVRRLKA